MNRYEQEIAEWKDWAAACLMDTAQVLLSQLEARLGLDFLQKHQARFHTMDPVAWKGYVEVDFRGTRPNGERVSFHLTNQGSTEAPRWRVQFVDHQGKWQSILLRDQDLRAGLEYLFTSR